MAQKRAKSDLEGGAKEDDSQLCESLVAMIIARIPYPNILRARCLSRDWNSQLTEAAHNTEGVRFFQTQVALASRAWPCYDAVIFCEAPAASYLTGYDACRGKWRKLWDFDSHKDKGAPRHYEEYTPNYLTLAGPLVSFCQDDDVVPGRFWTEVVNVVTGKFTRLTSSFFHRSGGNEFYYRLQTPGFRGTVLHGYPDGFVVAFVLGLDKPECSYLLIMFDSRKPSWYRELVKLEQPRAFMGICEQLRSDTRLTFYVWRKDETFEFREFDVLTRQWSGYKVKVASNHMLSSRECWEFETHQLMYCRSRTFLVAWGAVEPYNEYDFKLHVLECLESEGVIRHVSDYIVETWDDSDEPMIVNFSCGESKLHFGIAEDKYDCSRGFTIFSYDVEEGIWTSEEFPCDRKLIYTEFVGVFRPGLNTFTDPSFNSTTVPEITTVH